ncbi:ATP-binding cassette domain-containing protein [Silvibacterium sp.]|uniref:ATP-binding cassette domain-containing protein n=1 Tax=Silvibacterium sp. TaxID=1964179 RepID=UPI0039E3EA57
MSAAIEFRDVTLTVSGGRVLLDGVSFALEEGTTTALLGRSGCGKTTLLRTVNGMARPASGQVRVFGEDVQAADLIALRRGIGYVIQEAGLFPHFTVERNVGVVLECEGRPHHERRERSHAMLKAVGLDPETYAKRRPRELSGGQRQRVGLARALAAEPRLLLMDEPFGALDPLTRAEMQEMLRGLLRSVKKTVLLVTHDLDEALYLADRIVLLAEGRLIANLTAKEFLGSQEPAVQAYVRAFRRGEREAAGAKVHTSNEFCEGGPA